MDYVPNIVACANMSPGFFGRVFRRDSIMSIFNGFSCICLASNVLRMLLMIIGRVRTFWTPRLCCALSGGDSVNFMLGEEK